MRVGVQAVLAGLQDPGKGAKWDAHQRSSSSVLLERALDVGAEKLISGSLACRIGHF